MGKRYNDVLIRAGIIENTGGVGVDYFWLNDKLKTSLDLYDLNAENDVRGDKFHAKLSTRYTFLKHLDLYAGWDNFLNEDARNFFIGLGVRFVDDELKKFVGSAGSFIQ
jgi:phospholipid/cholesterol/gamma-HCH transport system substrate-binding protein